MTLSVPTFQIQCDEPGCRNFVTLLLHTRAAQSWSSSRFAGWYEIRDLDDRYKQLGGHTFPDGKHCCAECWPEAKARIDKRNQEMDKKYRIADYLDAIL